MRSRGAPRDGLTYFVFDLLHLDGQDIGALPLERRRRECEMLLRDQGREFNDPLLAALRRVALVQGDIVEIHAWSSTVKHLEQPDRIVLDLDPGEGVQWAQVVAAARQMRDLLSSLGLRCSTAARP